jgi:hypothetical protein
MVLFSSRNNLKRPRPIRNVLEAAPPAVRALLLKLVTEELGAVAGYQKLCEKVGRIPDPGIWGPSLAGPAPSQILEGLEWFEVFDLLEELAQNGRMDKLVNDTLEEVGLSYEMVDGHIEFWSEFADEMGIRDLAENAIAVV